jgi:hypothetical protein
LKPSSSRSLAQTIWFFSLALIIAIRFSALTGRTESDFLTGYLPIEIAFYVFGALTFYFSFLNARKFGSIEDIKRTLDFWIFLASFGLVTSIIYESGVGLQVELFSAYTLVPLLFLFPSIVPFLHQRIAMAEEFKRRQADLNVSSLINFCMHCGYPKGRNSVLCPRCGLNQYTKPVKTWIKKENRLYGISGFLLYALSLGIYFYSGQIVLVNFLGGQKVVAPTL